MGNDFINVSHIQATGYTQADLRDLLTSLYFQYTEMSHNYFANVKLPHYVDSHLTLLRTLIEASSERDSLVFCNDEMK